MNINGVIFNDLVSNCLKIFSIFVHTKHYNMINPNGQSYWLTIVNPNAGNGRGKKDWDKISRLLQKYQLPYYVHFTFTKGHAIKLASEGIRNGFRHIIVIGGDGTMNEVVNGIFLGDACATPDVTLGMITVGTGNDWGRMFGIPTDYEKAIKVIKENKTCLQDVGVVSYFHGNTREKRYFANIAGLGFDAVVVRRTNNQKENGKRGKILYFWNLLRSLMTYKHTQTEVVIDGQKISNHTFSISLGIGKYSGGGMRQTPKALPDDGLFDITVIKKISRREVIKSVRRLYDGSILEHPNIESYQGKDVKIDSDPLIHLEADGESLGHSPFEFEIIPKGINVIYNESLN